MYSPMVPSSKTGEAQTRQRGWPFALPKMSRRELHAQSALRRLVGPANTTVVREEFLAAFRELFGHELKTLLWPLSSRAMGPSATGDRAAGFVLLKHVGGVHIAVELPGLLLRAWAKSLLGVDLSDPQSFEPLPSSYALEGFSDSERDFEFGVLTYAFSRLLSDAKREDFSIVDLVQTREAAEFFLRSCKDFSATEAFDVLPVELGFFDRRFASSLWFVGLEFVGMASAGFGESERATALRESPIASQSSKIWREFSLEFAIELGLCTLRASTLPLLSKGDVLLLDGLTSNHYSISGEARLTRSGVALRGLLAATGTETAFVLKTIELQSAPARLFKADEKNMTQSSTSTSAHSSHADASLSEAGATTDPVVHVEEISQKNLLDLPVQLHIEIARASLSLAELSQMRIGDVLETSARIGDRVSISVDGQVLGKGELVDLDGRVGVRIAELQMRWASVSEEKKTTID